MLVYKYNEISKQLKCIENNNCGCDTEWTHMHSQNLMYGVNTLIGSILRKISKLPSDGQKTKKLGINGHINISKGHQILT